MEKKSEKQLLLEAKARVQRDKKFLQSVVASEKDMLCLAGLLVPGADAEKTEMVAGVPKERYRHKAQGVFSEETQMLAVISLPGTGNPWLAKMARRTQGRI